MSYGYLLYHMVIAVIPCILAEALTTMANEIKTLLIRQSLRKGNFTKHNFLFNINKRIDYAIYTNAAKRFGSIYLPKNLCGWKITINFNDK